MPAPDFDLFVIGGGSGGVRAARLAAQAGARVALAEEAALGGTCVNVGCIPKKLLVYGSHYAADFEDARAYGWEMERPRHDWERLRDAKDAEVRRLNGVYAKLLDEAGVTRIAGRARFTGERTLEVEGRSYSALHVLVAVGGRPHRPDVPGAELGCVSDDVFRWKQLPRRVAIVGGGYIAAEFAAILHGLGCEVTLLYHGPLFLRGFDEDVRRTLEAEYRRRGIDVRNDMEVVGLERMEGGLRVRFEVGGAMETEEVLFATGRWPNTAGLGLAEAGVETGPEGEVRVDALSRSSAPGVWAIGDCTQRLNLTPVAIAEATAFVRTAFGGEPTPPDHTGVPTAVFSQPPIGTVGLSEATARARGFDVEIYLSRFRPLRHTVTGREESALVKLVVDRASDRVLGCHMVGADAGEIVQGFAVALKCGATKARFDATVGIHPTSAEEFVTLRQPLR